MVTSFLKHWNAEVLDCSILVPEGLDWLAALREIERLNEARPHQEGCLGYCSYCFEATLEEDVVLDYKCPRCGEFYYLSHGGY